MVLWGYSPFIYSQTSNWKSNSEIYKCKFIKQVVSRWFKLWKKSVSWVCVFTQKGHIVDILPYSLVVFHTDLQKNTIVTCILTSQNHMMSNMQDWLLQLVQLIQYHHASSFSTVITDEFIGEEFCLGQISIDGYEAMGFDVTQLT